MRNRFKKRLWIVPLLIAGVVAAFGWWGNNQLRDTIQDQLKDQLNATLDANVTALEIWTTNQFKFVSLLAEEPAVRVAGLRMLEEPDYVRTAFHPGADQGKFAGYLRPRLDQMGYEIAQLVDTNYIVAGSSDRLRARPGVPIHDAQTNKFAELFAADQPVMITPFKPDLFFSGLPARAGWLNMHTNLLHRARRFDSGKERPRRGDITLMQVAAPVHDTNGMVRGALALIINPDTEFSRILSVARSGDSGETYAFDQTGLLISHSRFDPQLHQLGLLDATNTSSALYLRLHDPGGDLTAGYQPAYPQAADRPLIRSVADAVDGLDGADVEPFRDYRGVPVVSAWRWLPHLGFGVATQIDADEAYRPLHVVRLLFLMLLLLLVLCAIGMLLFSYANVASLRRLSAAELKLKQLGQYTLEEKIGEGGMGVVYRAHHALMRRDTAVKLLLPDRADPESIERFEREVCLTCRLTHPNTIQVYDYGHTPDGIFYYVMEYLRGLNLHDLTARFGPVPEGRVIYILTQVCDSLAEAHALGLIHRDIKPGNVFLCDRGGIPDCVKVLDFGLVQEYRAEKRREMNLSGPDMLEGTPWFMPPEAIADAEASDPRSDIYSVGALAYFLLAGTYAYDGETVLEIHQKQLAGPPLPPSQQGRQPVSPELDQLVLACLAIKPEARPQSAGELRELLMATPRAADWTMPQRTEWWRQFHRQPAPVPSEGGDSTSMETVSIDMGGRIASEE